LRAALLSAGPDRAAAGGKSIQRPRRLSQATLAEPEVKFFGSFFKKWNIFFGF
jgi:hypothetical protein